MVYDKYHATGVHTYITVLYISFGLTRTALDSCEYMGNINSAVVLLAVFVDDI